MEVRRSHFVTKHGWGRSASLITMPLLLYYVMILIVSVSIFCKLATCMHGLVFVIIFVHFLTEFCYIIWDENCSWTCNTRNFAIEKWWFFSWMYQSLWISVTEKDFELKKSDTHLWNMIDTHLLCRTKIIFLYFFF